MSGLRILGVILLVGGILALVYGGFSYTKETHEAELGPLELAVKEKERINVPVWVGIAGVDVGAILLATGGRRTQRPLAAVAGTAAHRRRSPRRRSPVRKTE